MDDHNTPPISEDRRSNVAALFQAPEGPAGEERLAAADPMGDIGDDDERDMIRLRNMRVDEIIAEYIGTRDQLDEKRHEWQAVERSLKGRIERMGMALKEKADAIGVDNFNSRSVGATAYRNTKISYRVADWTAFSSWIIATGNTQCLEKRVAKLSTAEIERQTGEVPPGVHKEVEQEFLVRRTSTS